MLSFTKLVHFFERDIKQGTDVEDSRREYLRCSELNN